MRFVALALTALFAAHATAHPEMHVQNDSSIALLTAQQLQVQSLAFECQSEKMKSQGNYFDALSVDNMKTQGACIADAEVTQGPYYIAHELMRADITDGQAGIPIEYQIEAVDVNTCEPAPGLVVEIWSCNNLGYYAGFTGIDPDTMKQTGDCLEDGTGSFNIQQQQPPPSGDGPGGSGGQPQSTCMTDRHTFLRGLTTTDSAGIATFYAKVPGYYTSRAAHNHLVIWEGGAKVTVGPKSGAPDGSAAQIGGTVLVNATSRHIGQLFYADDEIQAIYAANSELYPTVAAGTRTAAYTTLATDNVWKSNNGAGMVKLSYKTTAENVLTDGYIATVTVYFDRKKDAGIQEQNSLYASDQTGPDSNDADDVPGNASQLSTIVLVTLAVGVAVAAFLPF